MKLAYALVLSLSCASLNGAVIEVAKNGANPTLQAGVDAAQAGDDVVVKPGVFTERVIVPAGKNGLRIKAKSGAILDGFDSNGGAALTVGSDDVEVTGLTIRNAFANAALGFGILVNGNRPRIRKCQFNGCVTNNIRTKGSDPLIDDCTFRGSNAAVRIEGAGNATIEDCDFVLSAVGIALDALGSVTVVRSTFSTINFDAIQGDTSESLDVRNCKFRDIGGRCIDAEVGDDINVQKNSIDNATGAFLLRGSTLVVTNNAIRRIHEDVSPAIDLELGVCEVRNNVLQDCNAGTIFVGAAVTGFITKNKIQRCGSFPSAAIGVDSVANMNVGDNSIERVGGDGVRVSRGSGGGIVVVGNALKDCVRDGIDVGPQAVGVGVEDNVVRRCFAEGISNSGSNSTITGNDVKQCRLDLANDGTATFTANTFVTGGENVAPEID